MQTLWLKELSLFFGGGGGSIFESNIKGDSKQKSFLACL